MRTALFIVFLGLEDIASAILQSVNKTMETPPQAAVTFFAIALLLFIIMDISDFISTKRIKLEK